MNLRDKRYLIFKETILDQGIATSGNPDLIIPLANIFLEGVKDINKVIIPTIDAVAKLVSVLKNSHFTSKYVWNFAGKALPTSTEINTLFNSPTGLIVDDFNGVQVVLKPTATSPHEVVPNDFDGIIVITTTGALEVAGYVNKKWTIDTQPSSQQVQINKIIADIAKLQARDTDLEQELATQKTQVNNNTANIVANKAASTKNKDDITQSNINIKSNKDKVDNLNTAVVSTTHGDVPLSSSSLQPTGTEKISSKGELEAYKLLTSTTIQNMKEDIAENTNAIDVLDNENKDEHVLVGDKDIATFDLKTIVGDKGAFTHAKGDEFTFRIKDKLHNVGGSTDLEVGGTPQSVVIPVNAGASESVKLSVDINGILTVEHTSGKINVAKNVLLELVLQQQKTSAGGGVSKAEFNIVKDRSIANDANIAINKKGISDNLVKINKNIGDISNKQNIHDTNLTTTDKTIVGAINEVNAKPALKKPKTGETGPDFFKRLELGDRVVLDATHVDYYSHPVIATITFISATDLRADGTLSQDSDDYDNIEMTAKSNQDWKWDASLSWGGKIESGYPDLPLDEFPASQKDVKAYVTNKIKDIKDHDIKSLQDKDVIKSDGTFVDLSSMDETGAGTDKDKVLTTAKYVDDAIAKHKTWKDITSSYQTRDFSKESGKKVRINGKYSAILSGDFGYFAAPDQLTQYHWDWFYWAHDKTDYTKLDKYIFIKNILNENDTPITKFEIYE